MFVCIYLFMHFNELVCQRLLLFFVLKGYFVAYLLCNSSTKEGRLIYGAAHSEGADSRDACL